MKIVTPFKPFAPESSSHRKMADFDWPAAVEMLRASAWHASRTPVVVLGEQYSTTHDRLMLWLLEVSLRYLESDDFDQDTAMLSPDMLVFKDLSPFFRADLGIVARLHPKFIKSGRTLLFGMQLWKHAGKDRLIALYRNALAIAEGLSDGAKVWGADIEPFHQLIPPTRYGTQAFGTGRDKLWVDFIEDNVVMRSIGDGDMAALQAGRAPSTMAPVVDFRYTRKLHMRAFFDATVGPAVPA